MQARLTALEAENRRLAEELSAHPAEPDGTQEAKARMAETQAALSLAEQRLSNLAAQLESLQRRAQAPSRFVATKPLDYIPPEPQPHPPASSHSPAGELLNRNWGPEQVLGPPNTPEAGDIPTAWASRNPDGGEEWLKVDYQQPVDVAEVSVHESYNAGAIAKVTVFGPNGEEVTVWEGQEPPVQAPVATSFPVTVPVRANSVKLYLDTRRVPGWNEIDAVELVGRDGSRQWGVAATASSTYAEP